ncbi:Cj0069 family protein [Siccirubricoccus sp. KC 17139]|uniref:Cj0069 family protein n=1 Tax=Siccirubricoccus soli TaxID=2899147 RepID=A0ABT1D4D4_9PROT|nr:Cj0069 family protein [Siccirubricoccus soli]MCO6415845.1 Cj0069 family protein [Siccirubricoccus soli]MCP2681977.1 Cj0069 family protein [Siccirubricoccus soli]
MTETVGRLALLWRGDREARANATPANNRYHRIFEELAARRIRAEPAVYSEEAEDEVRAQLLGVGGVLVWVNPQDDGRNRHRLDAMLRDVAQRGVWVSAHPDVILKMGAKEVLQRTKHLGWGTDTHLYRSAEALRAEFPRSLQAEGPRVLKRNRGDGGQGTWKVELLPERDGMVRVLEARRGSVPEDVPLEDFLARCDEYFAVDGCVVDQPFQARLPDGMIRCYVGADRVVGFGHQLIRALIPPPPEGPDSPEAQPGPRIMHPASATQFQRLRALMEEEWTPRMMETLGIRREELPIIWDADFLYGPPTADGEDTYVLCEINVSCVFAIPDQAPAEIARLAEERLRSAGRSG